MQQEVLALIAAKRDMFVEEWDAVDGRDLMTPETTKWMRISEELMRANFSPCLRDGPACKAKWNLILPDYKRISDYLGRTGRNIPDYWDLSTTQRKEEGLPKQFPQEIFGAIDEWYGNRPIIQPPHVRDLLSPNDNNYRANERVEEGPEDDTSIQDSDDPMDLAAAEADGGTQHGTPPRSPRTGSSTPGPTVRPFVSAGTPLSRARPAIPPGVIPQVISSSDTSSYSLARRPGNTAVKRKTMSGHTIIAEATKATGAVMAKQMEDIAIASRELERSKIEVQLKLFSEQMSYQRQKDLRLYENAVAANENARLSIMKQSDIVHCLSQLSTVLGRSVTRCSTPEDQNETEDTRGQRTTEVPIELMRPPAAVAVEHEEENLKSAPAHQLHEEGLPISEGLNN